MKLIASLEPEPVSKSEQLQLLSHDTEERGAGERASYKVLTHYPC